MAKLYRGDPMGDPESYDAGGEFHPKEVGFGTFTEFVQCLAALPSTACLIRGAVKPDARKDVAEGSPVRRLEYDREECLAAFEAVARNWIMLDLDESDSPFDPDIVADSVEFWRESLPPEIKGAESAFFLSASSHRSDTLRGKLLVALAEPLDNASAEAWARAHGFDGSVCRTVQPNYLAPPVFVDCDDPLAGKRAPVRLPGKPARLPPVAPRERAMTLAAAARVPDDLPPLSDRARGLVEIIGERWLEGGRIENNAWLNLAGWLLGKGWSKGELGSMLVALDEKEPHAGKRTEHWHILGRAVPLDGPGEAREWLGKALFDQVDNHLTGLAGWQETRKKRKAKAKAEAEAKAVPIDECPKGTFVAGGETKGSKVQIEGPPILQARLDATHVLLWQGEDCGYQRVALGVLIHRICELGLDAKHGGPVDMVNGKARPIIEKNGVTFQNAIYDFTEAVSRFDKDQDCVMVGYPPPKIEPKQDPTVDEWLHALGGDSYERLASWIASCTQPHIGQLATALVLLGPANIGKGMLAAALAGLWGQTEAPEAHELVTRFNRGLCKCPIVLDDEAQVFGAACMSTKQFRHVIQAVERPIEEKGKEKYTLRGALRLIIACNSLSDLRFDDIGGIDVVQAVADRLCVIDAQPRGEACRAALENLRLEGKYLVDLKRVTAHLAWLAGNVKPSVERFIGGGGENAADAILTGHIMQNAALFESLADWIERGVQGEKPWRAVEGKLCVDTSRLADLLSTTSREWSLTKVREALMPVKSGECRPRTGGTNRPRLWTLDVPSLVSALRLDREAKGGLDKLLSTSTEPQKKEGKGRFGYSGAPTPRKPAGPSWSTVGPSRGPV